MLEIIYDILLSSMEKNVVQNTPASEAQPVPQGATQPVTQISEASKQKSWLVIGLAILVLLLLGTTSFFAYQNSQLKQQILQKPPTPLPKVTKQPEIPSPTPNIDSTTNWKRYNNSKYGFAFKYPDEFYLKEWPQADGTFSLTVSDQEDYDSPSSLKDKKIAISIFVGGGDFERSDFYYGGYQWTKDILDDLLSAPIGAEKEHKFDLNTKLSNIEKPAYTGITYKSIPKESVPTSGTPLLNAALSKNSTTILISARAGGNSELVFSKPYSDTFNQVLSTFEFLN